MVRPADDWRATLRPPEPVVEEEKAWWETAVDTVTDAASTGLGFIMGRSQDIGTVQGAGLQHAVNSMTPVAASNGRLTTGSTYAKPLEDPRVLGAGARLGADLRNPALSIAGPVLAPLALTIAALDTGTRALNTGIGGTTLLYQGAIANNTGQLDKAANPLLRDGFQPEDVVQTFKMMWGGDEAVKDGFGNEIIDPATGQPVMVQNSVTAGQAISLTVGRSAQNMIDFVVPGDQWAEWDKAIIADTNAALKDPANSRGLFSWASGLYSEFDIFNYHERESAFNQGAGRWISGASDAAIQWYIGVDVIAAKVAGHAGRSLFTQTFESLGDLDTLATQTAQHAAWKAGQDAAEVTLIDGTVKTVEAQRTAAGQLMESLMKLDAKKVARHEVARASNNGLLVSRVLGNIKDYDTMVKAFRAFAGDVQAMDELFAADAIAMDALKMQKSEIDHYRAIFDMKPEQMMGFSVGDVAGMQARARAAGIDEAAIAQMDEVYQQAVKENAPLRGAIEAFGGRNAGVSDIQFSGLRLSRLQYGPNSVARLEANAEKAANRAISGGNWAVGSYKAGGAFGRPIMVFKSSLGYMKTMRQNGVVNLSDNGDDALDIFAEADAMFGATKMFRVLSRQGTDVTMKARSAADQAEGIKVETVIEFRDDFYRRMVQAKSANERRAVMTWFENRAMEIMAAYYGIERRQLDDIAAKYRDTKTTVVHTLQRHGWFDDNGTIVAMPEAKVALDDLELQSQMAENFYLMDFDWLEKVVRIDKGSFSAKTGKRGDTFAGALDAVWRPLVLMRLGYTQRNVAEGWLRELASYGSIGMLVDRKMGTRGIDESDKALLRWGQQGGRAIDRTFGNAKRLLTHGSLRRAVRELQAGQESASKIHATAVDSEQRLSALDEKIATRRAKVEKQARIEETENRRDIHHTTAGAVWEDIDTEWRGRVDDAMRGGMSVIIPPRFVEPLTKKPRRDRVKVTAFTDEEESFAAQATADENITSMFDEVAGGPGQYNELAEAGDYDELDAGYSAWLSASENQQLLNLRAQIDAGADVGQQVIDLYSRAQFRAAERAMRDGDYVVIVNGDGSVYRVHDLTDVAVEDVDALAVIKQANAKYATHVRATVYGDMLDLRPRQITLEQESLDAVRAATAEDAVSFPYGGADRQALDKHLDLLFQDLGIVSTRSSTLGKLEEMHLILDMAEKDPFFNELLAFNAMIKRLSMTNPQMVKWFEDKGLLIDSHVVKSVEKMLARTPKKQKEAEDEYTAAYDEMWQKLQDPDFWRDLPEANDIMEWGFSFHGGTRIPGDRIAIIPPKTQENVENLHGMGFYTTQDPGVAGEYILNRGIRGDGEPVMYMVAHDPEDETRFLNMDEDYFPVTFGLETDADSWALADEMRGIYDDMAESLGLDVRADDNVWGEVEEMMPMAAAGELNGQAYDNGIETLRVAMTYHISIHYAEAKGLIGDAADIAKIGRGDELAEDGLTVAYDVQKAWMDAFVKRGLLGVRHEGGSRTGNEAHNVFIWYAEPDDLVPIESLTQEAMEVQRLRNRLHALNDKIRTDKGNLKILKNATPFDAARMDASRMGDFHMRAMTQYMNESGRGGVFLPDSASPSGYRLIVNPDRMSVASESADTVLPSSLVGRDYGDDVADQMWGETLKQNTRVFSAEGMHPGDLYNMTRNDEVSKYLAGETKSLSKKGKVALARWMEVNNHTHVATAKGETKTISELIGGKQTGSMYGAMLDADEIAQRQVFLASQDDTLQTLLAERSQVMQEAQAARGRLSKAEEENKALVAKLEARLGKRRAKGGQVKAKVGTGEERFRSQHLDDELTVSGPLSDAEQGQMWATLSGSDRRVMMDLMGYSDRNMRRLQKTTETKNFVPGEDGYFEVLSEQINRFWRNDPVMQMLLSGKTEDEVFDELMKTARGRAWVRDQAGVDMDKDLIDEDTLSEVAAEWTRGAIEESSSVINDFVPDGEMREFLANNDVSPMWLRQQLGWRGDLPSIRGFRSVHKSQTEFRGVTSAVMHALGTVPENHLVRHPFFRARWREEMQRQVDLFGEQLGKKGDWDGRFTEEQISRMMHSSKAYALKQTNETLYSITRMSTPAHAMRFIMPFYPAWFSSMKYWLGRVPVENPQNIVRYGMVWNAPNSMGMYQDENGQPVKSASQEGNGIPAFIENLTSKWTGADDGNMVIQLTPAIAEKMAFLTGGNSTLSISKGSLDVLLQGETFFIPGLGPLVAMPSNWIASLKPDWATTLETGELTGPLYDAILPFGPTKEKDFIDAATEAWTPAAVQRAIQGMRGMDSAAFSNATNSIYRDMIVDWEISGRTGPTPSFLDATDQASDFFKFRIAVSLTSPTAVGFQSKYKFYSDEWRRIERKFYDLQDSNPNDPSIKDGANKAAQNEFLTMYGPQFYAMTQSLSGSSSGMGANVGEFKEFDANPELMAGLASIGDDASYITMATRPFANAGNEEGFDPAVYAWQFNRHIEGAPNKTIRAGATNRRDMILDVHEQVGWYEWNKINDQLEPLYEAKQISHDVYTEVKRQAAQAIGKQYPAWFVAYNDSNGSRSMGSDKALDTLVNNKQWMDSHGDTTYAKSVVEFKYNRDAIIAELQRRATLPDGSSNIEAKSNADLALVYEELVKYCSSLDPGGDFINMHSRFFGSDKLKAIPDKKYGG